MTLQRALRRAYLYIVYNAYRITGTGAFGPNRAEYVHGPVQTDGNPLKAALFKQFSKYPFIEKDVSFIVDNEVLSGDLEDSIYKAGQPLITAVGIFDLYAGEKRGGDKKSIAFRMRFQSPDRTLQDKEVNALFEKIIGHIIKKYSATLREE